MTTNDMWNQPLPAQLAHTLAALAKSGEMQRFLKDVMTEKEIIEIAARLEAAKMLNQGKKYTDIITATRLSSRTIARIAQWLKNGSGGYAIALTIIDAHQTHTKRLIK